MKLTRNRPMLDTLARMVWEELKDWGAKLALADLYEEEGEPMLARVYRWMGKYHKHPNHRTGNILFAMVGGSPSTLKPHRKVIRGPYSWAWYPDCGNADSGVLLSEENLLIPPLFASLPKIRKREKDYQPVDLPSHAFYPSYEAAVNDLANALDELLNLVNV